MLASKQLPRCARRISLQRPADQAASALTDPSASSVSENAA
jgi:hypothetical protein